MPGCHWQTQAITGYYNNIYNLPNMLPGAAEMLQTPTENKHEEMQNRHN